MGISFSGINAHYLFVLRVTLQSEFINTFDTKVADLFFSNRFIEFFHYIGEPTFVVSVAIVLIVYLAWKAKITVVYYLFC